jgi:hypothetical protein
MAEKAVCSWESRSQPGRRLARLWLESAAVLVSSGFRWLSSEVDLWIRFYRSAETLQLAKRRVSVTIRAPDHQSFPVNLPS